MSSHVIVSNKADLKKAIENKIDQIIITDSALAQNIKVLKYSSRFALGLAIAGTGVAVTNFWNPVGLTAGVAAFAVTGSTTTAMILLGVGATALYAIYNNYDIKGKCKVKLPNGVEVEAEMVLNNNK